MKEKEYQIQPGIDKYKTTGNDGSGFSGWDEVAAFYCQQKRARTSLLDINPSMPSMKMEKTDPLANSLELKNEIKVTSRIDGNKHTYVYSWQCNGCAENGVNTYYEVESCFSMRLHVIYHFCVCHQKDRRRLLGMKEKDLLEKEIGYPIIINSNLEERLRGQLPSDIDLLSICVDNPCLVPLLLACYSEAEKKNAFICFCYKICFGISMLRLHCENEHGIIPRSVEATTSNEVISHMHRDEQNRISVYPELLDDSNEREKLLNKILSPGGILCQSNYNAVIQQHLQSEQNLFASSSNRVDDIIGGIGNGLANDVNGIRGKEGFQANARSMSCRHCKRRIPGSSKTGCHLRLVYHLFNDHKTIKAIVLEAEREKLKLEQLLDTKLDFSDRSNELESVVKKTSKSHLSSWLTKSRIKDPKVISFLRKESLAEGNVMVCFCYRTFVQCEPYLAHVRKAHVFRKSEMSRCSALPSSSSCDAMDIKPEKIVLAQMQTSLAETVDSWLDRYNKELSQHEKAWMCFICKRTLVPTTPRIAKLDVFMQLHIMHHLATLHSDDQKAVELVDFGRSLWKDRLGVELIFRKALPAELRTTFNVQECLNVLFDLNANLLRAIEVQSRMQWDRKNIMCFCFRVMGEKLILKHLRDEHFFHIWRCDVIPNTSTGKPYRCYCRCHFCKAYMSCDFSELSLRLVAFMHLRKHHSADPVAAEYGERERAYLESCLKTDLSILPEPPNCSRLLTINEARELFAVKDEGFVSAIKGSAFQGISAPEEAVICGCYHTLFNESRFKQHMKAAHNINVKRKRTI